MMNWHGMTEEEIDGKGDHRWLVDIQPDDIPHQATADGDALVRIQRRGWSWLIRDQRKRERKDKSPAYYMGTEETREEAIASAFEELARLRAEEGT